MLVGVDLYTSCASDLSEGALVELATASQRKHQGGVLVSYHFGFHGRLGILGAEELLYLGLYPRRQRNPPGLALGDLVFNLLSKAAYPERNRVLEVMRPLQVIPVRVLAQLNSFLISSFQSNLFR